MFLDLNLDIEGNKWSPLIRGKRVPAQSSLLRCEFKTPRHCGNNSHM